MEKASFLIVGSDAQNQLAASCGVYTGSAVHKQTASDCIIRSNMILDLIVEFDLLAASTYAEFDNQQRSTGSGSSWTIDSSKLFTKRHLDNSVDSQSQIDYIFVSRSLLSSISSCCCLNSCRLFRSDNLPLLCCFAGKANTIETVVRRRTFAGWRWATAKDKYKFVDTLVKAIGDPRSPAELADAVSSLGLFSEKMGSLPGL